MFDNIIANVHKTKPLIHSITNYVSMNDCANILLASGGAAIMAEDVCEVEEITALCDGLNINIGMLIESKLEAMLAAGKKAVSLNHPVILDPVGAGASKFRTDSALRLIKELDITVIRGNISEIKALSAAFASEDSAFHYASKGVEANDIDRVSEDNLPEAVQFARVFAHKTGMVVCITGAIDIVTDGSVVYCIRNGHPMMSRVTGAGCQLSTITAAYVAAGYKAANVNSASGISSPDTKIIAEYAAAAVSVMGISGETAYKRMGSLDGYASYRNYIIDAVYNMTDELLSDMCKVEVMNYE